MRQTKLDLKGLIYSEILFGKGLTKIKVYDIL